jgi:hypothetical protein
MGFREAAPPAEPAGRMVFPDNFWLKGKLSRCRNSDNCPFL